MSQICNICASPRNRYLFDRSDKVFGRQSVRQCRDCGLIFADPIPPVAFLRGHYNKAFFTERFDYVENGLIWGKFYERNLEYIERIKKVGKLLEIGCGLGHFLNVAKKRGWFTAGVELSEFAASYASENFQIKIHSGVLEEAPFTHNQFDVIVLWATLEHLTDPLGYLTQIHKLLAPGGLLAFSVPNHNSLITRLQGMDKTDMQYCEHLYQFPLKTIRIILDKTGFYGMRRMVILGGSPKKSHLQDGIQFSARLLNIGSDIRIIAFKK